MIWQHDAALVVVGFAGGVLFMLGILAGIRARPRRGDLEFDTPQARERIGRPW